MSLQPTPEQWQALQLLERFNFKVMHSLNSSPIIRPILTKLCVVFGRRYVEILTSNIVLDHGFENFEKIDPNKGLLMVVNHRTFYDQPVVHMVMGEPLDFSEERKMEENRKTFLQISKKVMNAIGKLARREQEIRAKFEGQIEEAALP